MFPVPFPSVIKLIAGFQLQLVLPSLGEKSALTPLQEIQAYYMCGMACLNCKDPRKGEQHFEKALELRMKSEIPVPVGKKKSLITSLDNLTEQDIRYQICQCRIQVQDYQRALAVVQVIPVEQRSPKTLIAMAGLFHRDKNRTESQKCYEEVVSRNPLALDAVLNLIRMDVRAAEIISRIGPSLQALVAGSAIDWITSWIEVQACMHSYKTEKSVELARKLVDSQSCDNPELLITLGQAYYLNGDHRKAISVFKSLYAKDTTLVKGMDTYAAALAAENEVKTLEELTNRMLIRCENGEELPEPWIVVAQYTFMTSKKDSKALYFAQKACLASSNSIESLLLKAKIMSESKSASEAIPYFIEAYAMAPFRFDVLKALTEAYLAENKRTQATSMANVAVKHFAQAARALTLHASVLLTEPDKAASKKSARSLLEKAVNKDRSHLPAVYALAKIYMDEKSYDKALDVLNRCLEHESTNKLHRMLGDCYTQVNDHVKAMHHQNIAKKLEVSYRSTTEAAQSLNAGTNHPAANRSTPAPDQAIDVDIDELAESDNDDMEEADGGWSDNFDE
jgi:tetratricopeptide (TPR) repeat protein